MIGEPSGSPHSATIKVRPSAATTGCARGSTSVVGVVDRTGVRHADGEGQCTDGRVLGLGPDRVRHIRGCVDEIALLYFAFFVADLHDPATADDVVELVRRMTVRVD